MLPPFLVMIHRRESTCLRSPTLCLIIALFMVALQTAGSCCFCPMPAGRTTEEAVNPPAPGGGPGLVWVNTEAGVYHGERSPFYGTTGKGKYMTEQDAIKAGYKRAPKGR
jgi:hypothetical protein